MLDRFDQAQGLRRLFARTSVRVVALVAAEPEPFVAFAAALAAAMARLGHRPVLLDADRARLAPALGLRARYDLLHVMRGDCGIEAALCPDPVRGFALLPAARGLDALTGRDDVAQLFGAFGRLRPAFDTALVAAPAERLVRVLGAGIEPLVLAATDPAGVQAAWRQVSALHQHHGLRRVRVAWCQAGAHSAVRAHGLLAEALARHLGMDACDAGAFGGPADAEAIGRIAAGALEAASVEFVVPAAAPSPAQAAVAGPTSAPAGAAAAAAAAA